MKTCHSKVHGGSPLQVWAVSAKFLPDEARSKFSILQPEPLCKNWWRDLSTFVIAARHQIWLTSIRGVPAWAAVRKSQRWHRNWWKTGNSCVALMVQAIESSCWKMISGWYKEVHHEWWRACCPEAWSGQWASSSNGGNSRKTVCYKFSQLESRQATDMWDCWERDVLLRCKHSFKML